MEHLRSGDRHLVRLHRGDEIVGSITELARRLSIAHASVTGIGALADVELGYFCTADQSYDRILLTGQYELLSLVGNLARVDGEPFLHAHVTLGSEAFQVAGGHLFKGTVSATAEIFLDPGEAGVQRRHDPQVGLKLWDLGGEARA